MAVKIAVMMKVRMTLSLPLIFLLMISGVLGENWNVIYESTSVCALKGSTVNMSCSYTYPQQYKLTDTFWIKTPDVEMKSLKEYLEYKDRVEYIEDRQKQTAVLRLYNITKNDERVYFFFKLVTDTEGQKWTGQPGIQLKVSALQVKAPQLVLEKERVNLTCESTCSLTDGFIWYKNGQALKIQNKTLQLQSERSDSGRYSCAVRGHEDLPSPAVSIDVMYPPKSVSVSISPSGEIVEGNSVTLICSSDSNPPALNFSWFKENQSSAVGSGKSFIISSFNSSHSGRYYCEAQNQHGSQRSAYVSVSVKGDWDILYIIAVCVTSAIIVGCGLLFLIIIIVHKRTKKSKNDSKDTEQKKTSAGKASESRDAENASAQDDRDTDTKKPEAEEIAYASITFHHPANEAKSAASQDMDVSVIYSGIR
ncbi:B-cell receptor CD22 isoform X2 [Carassius gibelio]|uniref:B-cell receptor CD22 isoform X2 n=1 Tax=Carassius gibelio TaxID=101364 RepID=UPI002278733F|nr:B-cell receptor CD22 isoform X2 [Carassius gibelio]